MKKIKSEGAVKSKTPYRMKFIKKVATIASAVVLSAALFVGAAFTLTGCNNEKDPIDPNPPIVDPIPDPEPDPDPDPEPEPEPEPDPEPDPDPDPDPNPDPNPDPDPEPEPEPDPMPEYDEIDTIEELYGTEAPVLEEFTEEKYGSNYKEFYNNEVREYNEAQEKQAKIYETLNSTLLDNMVERSKVNNAAVENVQNLIWEINTLEDGKTIKNIKARYFHDDTKEINYVLQSVTTTDKLTLSDLYEPDVEKLEDAFTVGNPFNPKASYTKEYGYYCEKADQEKQEELLNAINEKIKTELTGDVQSFIKVNGGAVDTELGGTASRYVILNVSENGYEEYSLSVLDSSNGKTEIENLNNDKYYTYSEKSATYEGKFLDENSGKDRLEEIEIDKEQTQTKKSMKYVAKVSLPKEDGTFEEFEIEL